MSNEVGLNMKSRYDDLEVIVFKLFFKLLKELYISSILKNMSSERTCAYWQWIVCYSNPKKRIMQNFSYKARALSLPVYVGHILQ